MRVATMNTTSTDHARQFTPFRKKKKGPRTRTRFHMKEIFVLFSTFNTKRLAAPFEQYFLFEYKHFSLNSCDF